MAAYGQEGEVYTFHRIFFWEEEYSFIHKMKDKEQKEEREKSEHVDNNRRNNMSSIHRNKNLKNVLKQLTWFL